MDAVDPVVVESAAALARHLRQGRDRRLAVLEWFAEAGTLVAEDRRLRLAGYEIYRFGGWELTQPHAEQLVKDFFTELLTRHEKPTP